MTEKEAKVITKEYIRDFFRLSEEDTDALYASLKRIEYRNADRIVTVGDPADGMYFIDDGTVDVVTAEGETVNEMGAGQFFGEYAVIAEEPRMTSCYARGKVIAYKIENEELLGAIAKRPTIVGYLLKQVYSQVSAKHSKLLEMARARRGILQPPPKHKAKDLVSLLITYTLVVAVFVLVYILCPKNDEIGLLWLAIPPAFFVLHNIFTRRTLETFVLTLALTYGIANGGHFFKGFVDSLVAGITTPDTASTIIIMALIGAVTALLDAAGAISALKRPAERGIHTVRGVLFAMLGMLALIFIDDYLNLLAAAFCLIGVMDRNRIPREVPVLLGTTATAVCSVIPLSVWGAYISGTIVMTVGARGGEVFLKSILCNYASIFAIIGAILLCFGKLPKSKLMRNAYRRVESDGSIWPEGSEKYFMAKDEHEIYGSLHNLLIPLIVMVVSTVAIGTIQAGGKFSLNAAIGLAVTVVVMFFLYCGERLMTPEKFLDCVVSGIQNTILPILLLLLTVCFSNGLQMLDFQSFAENIIPEIMGGYTWMLPAVMFIAFTLLTILTGSSWGMYGIGIPVAAHLSAAVGMNLPFAIGSVCAAGIVGENLMPYLPDGSILVSGIGCTPEVVRKLRLQYWGCIAGLCVVAYLIVAVVIK